MVSYQRNRGSALVGVVETASDASNVSGRWRAKDLKVSVLRAFRSKKFKWTRRREKAARSSGAGNADLIFEKKRDPDDNVMPPFFYCP